MWETIFFWVFAFGAVFSSLAVILIPRNPLYSALALILDFFFFAGLYALLSAHFLAVTQVLVYGGAIMVLFMFIIMLLNLREEELERPEFRVHHVLAVVVGLVIFGFSFASFEDVVDWQTVTSARDAATQQAEAAATEEEDVKPVVQTESPIPGLFVDLNERGTEERFSRTIDGWDKGVARPADRKYREFNPNAPVDIPPQIAGDGQPGSPNERVAAFGTVEPISALLVNRFVVPFELTALLLLAAIVGAVIIAKKRL
jgi:NADH-quinone oxidoreductase subunit J